MLDSFFITGDLPSNIEYGIYRIPLVVLSYAVASFASYSALALARQLVTAKSHFEKSLFRMGGAFALGAGIWSMHFVGMLSYKMRMVVTYDPLLTMLSMAIAIIVAYGVLSIVAREKLNMGKIIIGAVLLGFGISGMHYTGMAAMKMGGEIRYIPGLFMLSVAVAIAASAAALWLAFKLARHSSEYAYIYQIIAALVMGGAICGMHYIGMHAAVFIPYADCIFDANQNFDLLAISIAGITTLIICMALAAGFYRKTQAEFRLQHSESKLRNLIDNALDAVISMDKHGLITEWNKQAENIFGWSREEATGKNLAEMIIPPQYREAHNEGLRRFFADGTGPILNKRLELEAINRKGDSFPVELTVTVQQFDDDFYFTAFLRDITEQKQSERNKSLMAAIVSSSDDAIIGQTLDSVIRSWNTGAEKLFGYSEAEAIGQNINIIMPEDKVSEENNIMLQLSEGQSIRNFETIRKHKDGHKIFISLTVSPINNAAGQVVAASKIARDITVRKETELSLKRYMRDLERSNQELDDFAYIASHDLKEPLRGLFNHATFLIEDYKDKLDEDGLRRLHRLIYLSQRMDHLVSDLLYFSRLGRSELAIQETDPNLIVYEVQQLMQSFLKERNVRIIVPKTMPNIICDKPRITEVFRNLITNAAKYNDKTERIVEVGFLEQVDTPQGVEQNVFYVKDNGIGIVPTFYKEIFRIFKRLQTATGEKEEGTGVGLTFVKKIIERHKGRVWLESEPGVGTIFYFNLNQN